MPLLNYTTSVPVAKTLAEVTRLLVDAGARSISTTYGPTGSPTGVAFTVETAYGPRSFALPARAERVQAVLGRQKVETRYRTPEQAERVAWRIVKDWLEAQLALIRTEMVALDQVMLPYMVDDESGGGHTVYELYVERAQQRALAAGGR